jgi:predicted choloylglycine hydrolase
MREFVLTGSYYEMGKQYGQYCRKDIKLFTKAIQIMTALSEHPGADFFSPKYRYLPSTLLFFFKNRKRYRAQAREFIDNLRRYYPEGLEMLTGMAEGARVHFDDLLFLNVVAETSFRCTVIAAAGSETITGEPILAMNADEHKGTEKYEIMLDLQPDTGYRYKVASLAGALYYNFGMNEKGLTLTGEFLWLKIDPTVKNRMPMLLAFSILNRCATVDEAQELLEALPNFGVGTAIYIGDSEKFLRIESNILDREIEVVGEGVRWNANNPQSRTMIPYSKIDTMDEATTLFSGNRNKRLEHFAEKYGGQFDTDAMHTIISDHDDPNDETHMRSMCMHPKHTNGAQTCASIIAMPRQKRFRIYETNPCLNKMKVYRF